MKTMLLSVLSFIVIGACWAVIVISAVIYRGRGSKSFLHIGLYAVVQLLLELKVRGFEVGAPLYLWMEIVFSNTTVIKGLLYGAAAFLLLRILVSVFELEPQPVAYAAPAGILLWLFIFSLIRSQTVLGYLLYLLPYQVYTCVLAGIGLRRMRLLPPQEHFPMLRGMLMCVIALTVLTVLEDAAVCFGHGMLEDAEPLIRSGHLKGRNFCECTMQLLILGCAIHAGMRVLTGALCTDPAQEPGTPPRDAETADRFAEAIGLSRREKEVLPFLLANMAVADIAEALFISEGTVKSHTHNIYQKAGVNDRIALIRKADAFFSSGETG